MTADERTQILREYEREYKRTTGKDIYAEFVNGWVRLSGGYVIGTYRMNTLQDMLLRLKARPETKRETMNAASEWRTDEPPKDGTPILAVFFKYDNCTVVTWSDARGFWFIGDDRIETNPDYWAHINHPEGKEWV